MPRRSAASLLVVTPPKVGPTRLRPPPSLSEPERQVFIDIVAAARADHFEATDLPLLCRYCEAVVLAERAAAELRQAPVSDGKLSPWITVQEKAVRALVALSMRLRLSPQARRPNPSTARPDPSLSIYERMRLDDDAA